MGKFVIKQAKNGEYYFNLKAANGEVIGTSEMYPTVKIAEAGIDAVRRASVGEIEDQTVKEPAKVRAPKFEIFKTKDGQFRFRLKAGNYEPVLASESYKAKDSCKNGIASVKKNAPESPIVYQF